MHKNMVPSDRKTHFYLIVAASEEMADGYYLGGRNVGKGGTYIFP